MSKGKFAIGALIVAAAGFFAGILSAPKSGKDTREDLKKEAEALKNEATETVEKFSDEFSEVADSAKQKAGQVVNEVKTTATDLKERTERAAAGAKKGFFDKK